MPADSPDHRSRTRKFQQVNDAYYVLSDPTRRRDYDATRRTRPSTAGAGPGAGADSYTPPQHESFAADQFGSIFEEMLNEEGMTADSDETAARTASSAGRFWSIVGGMSGGALGFIVANFPGAIAGMVAGNRLGAVRDAKKKSVYEVFQALPQSDRARLLSGLAARMLQSAVS